MLFRSLGIFLGTVALQATCSDAFTMQQPKPCSRASSSTTLMADGGTDDELNKLDSARANFEFLMQTEGLLRDNVDLPLPRNPEDYTPRPLTESSRHRRQLEMDLLESLVDSDEAIEELMTLWMVERGVEAGEALQQMEVACSPGLLKEEEILRDLLDEFGVQ